MDVIIPRKVTFPDNPELAIGAVTFDGGVEIDHVLVDKLRLTPADLEQLAFPARLEIERRLKLYRGARPGPQLGGRDIILIDDGLATGYTMKAAVRSVLRENPRRVVIAVPVSPASTCEQLRALVDQVVVLHLAQESFFAVGSFYDNFTDQPENELIRMLSESHAPAQRSAQSGI
jgi:predicted phosphoribosyltransferase